MEKHLCSGCNREFQTDESLSQHRQAKHTQQPSVAAARAKGKVPKKIVVAVVILLVVVGGYFIFAGKGSGNEEKPLIDGSGGSSNGNGFDEKAFAAKIPKEAIH